MIFFTFVENENSLFIHKASSPRWVSHILEKLDHSNDFHPWCLQYIRWIPLWIAENHRWPGITRSAWYVQKPIDRFRSSSFQWWRSFHPCFFVRRYCENPEIGYWLPPWYWLRNDQVWRWAGHSHYNRVSERVRVFRWAWCICAILFPLNGW